MLIGVPCESMDGEARVAITPEVVKAQQEIADRFYQEKLIPKQIEINPIIWTQH